MTTQIVTLEGSSISVEVVDVSVDVSVAEINVDVETTGPHGPPARWMQLTMAQYNAIPAKDKGVLYVVNPEAVFLNDEQVGP